MLSYFIDKLRPDSSTYIHVPLFPQFYLLIFNYLDWIPVERGKRIDFDLETTPLYVKTDSEVGSNDEVRLRCYDTSGLNAAGVTIAFYSPPKYALWHCLQWFTFPDTLPSDAEKVWKITLNKTSGIRFVIHCNDIEVVNVLVSDYTCNSWNRDVDTIEFESSDTASDFYSTKRPISPGNRLNPGHQNYKSFVFLFYLR